MLFMALIVVLNVLGRYFFHTPLPATIEIVGLGAAVMISFSLFSSQFWERNISVPIVVEKLGPKALKVFTATSLALSLCIVAVFVYTEFGFALEMLEKGEKTSVLRMPLGPFRLVWTLGCVLIFLVMAVQFVRTLGKGGK
jgi:TRAP-type C4-dicarboxylate transport system permease small subunit